MIKVEQTVLWHEDWVTFKFMKVNLLWCLPLLADHTVLGSNLWQQGGRVRIVSQGQLMALSSGLWRMTPALQSDRLLFYFALDKWQCGLSPVACPFILSLSSFFLHYFISSLNGGEKIDFVCAICWFHFHFVSFFVSFAVKVDVGSDIW